MRVVTLEDSWYTGAMTAMKATEKVRERATAKAVSVLSKRGSYRDRLTEARSVFADRDESLARLVNGDTAYASYIVNGSTA